MMRVIGIDPAPKNDATIYDGHDWSTCKAQELPDYIHRLSKGQDDLLVCWDAPLTAGKEGPPGCYYVRQIEKFFNPPRGISVQAYAGCPHWAVTQAAVGLPRLGKFNCNNIPLKLCVSGECPQTGKNIVEVHPAVAIWLWCKASYTTGSWEYKENKETVAKLWKELTESIAREKYLYQSGRQAPANDDELDAYVAWLLGTKWQAKDGVVLLGNADTGSFLVPDVDIDTSRVNIKLAFAKFIERM
jgi:hypothetical protein